MRPEGERWDAEALAGVQSTPWSLRERTQPTVTFRESAEHSGPGADTAAPPVPRHLRINQSDLDAHGYIEGCQQCEYIQRYGKARVGGQHSNRCRDRLVEAIRTTDYGSNRIAAHDVRSAGYDVVREEFNERQRVRAELVQASKA